MDLPPVGHEYVQMQRTGSLDINVSETRPVQMLQIVYDDGSVPFTSESEVCLIENVGVHTERGQPQFREQVIPKPSRVSDDVSQESFSALSEHNTTATESNTFIIDENAKFSFAGLENGGNIHYIELPEGCLQDEHGQIIIDGLQSDTVIQTNVETENLSPIDHEYSQKLQTTRSYSSHNTTEIIDAQVEDVWTGTTNEGMVWAPEDNCSNNVENDTGVIVDDSSTENAAGSSDVLHDPYESPSPPPETSAPELDTLPDGDFQSDENPMYTLVHDVASLANIKLNISQPVAQCLRKTFAQKSNDDLLPVVKLQTPTNEKQRPKPLVQGPVFKVCKMVRKPDGTVQCIQTDMRDISYGDRQAVYRTMLQKFPDIVHRKVASVMTNSSKRGRTRKTNQTMLPSVNSHSTSQENRFLPARLETESTKYSPDPNETPAITDSGQDLAVDDSVALTSSDTLGPHLAASRRKTYYVPSILKPEVVRTKFVTKSIIQPVIKPKPPTSTHATSVGQHACQLTTMYWCIECKNKYKTESDFTNHALIAYVKVTPHLFAPDCVMTCTLCKDTAYTFRVLADIKKHLYEIHCYKKVTECGECSKNQLSSQLYDPSMMELDNGYGMNDSPEVQVLSPEISVEQKNKPPPTYSDVIRVLKQVETVVYTCCYCDKEFNNKKAWRRHVRAHLRQRPMSCPLCGMSFLKKKSLQMHMDVHLSAAPENMSGEGENKPPKKIRKKLRASQIKKRVLPTMVNEEVGPKPVEAASSVKQQYDGNNVRLPKKVPGPVLCELCGKQLKNSRQLDLHHRRRHNYPCKRPIKANLTPMPCSDCGKMFNGPTGLKNHQRKNFCGLKEVLCEICGKVFPFGGRALANHKYQVHKWHGSDLERKFLEKAREKSKDQGKGEPEFDEDGNQISPKPKKPFKPQGCELCSFVAKYPANLRHHMVNKHKYPKKHIRLNVNTEPKTCDKCGTVCKGVTGLKIHQKRFCGRPPGNLACPICGKVCANRKNLSRHKYGHKWFGTEKEKAWKERRKMLALQSGKKQAELTESSPVGAEVILQTSEDSSQNQVVQVTTETTIEPDQVEDPLGEVEGQELILDSTNHQLLQAIANDPQFAGQTIQVTTELDPSAMDLSALATSGAEKGNTFKVIRLINHLGEPILAYLPHVQESV